jgi:hypothetical protein
LTFELESITAELITPDKYNDHISDQTIETMEALGAMIWTISDNTTSGGKCYCRITLNPTKTEITKKDFVIPNPEYSNYYLDLDKGL